MLTFESKRNDILAALDGTAYSRTEEGARLEALRGKIRWFSRIRGNALSENDISDTALTLDNALMRNYDSLPLKEIELALEWEMVAGESIRLTVHNMLKGVARYIASDERKSAFALAARDRRGEKEPPTRQEVNLLNFDAMLGELLLLWEGYLMEGRMEPYRLSKRETAKDGWKGDEDDTLRLFRRHVNAGCYAWLRTYGVVPDDEETKRRERVCISNARKEGATAVGIYAEALMLEWLFSEAVKTNRDLGSEINRAAGLATEIVRMNTPLRHLQTN